MNVYTYSPAQHHCREGWAIETKRGHFLDTFWGGGNDQHLLTEDEIDSLVFQFDTEAYEELDQYNRSMKDVWATYNSADRASIPSQHGLQHRYFVRKGSAPDHLTMVENAVQRVRDAKTKAESAQRDVEWAEQELVRLASQSLTAGDPR